MSEDCSFEEKAPLNFQRTKSAKNSPAGVCTSLVGGERKMSAVSKEHRGRRPFQDRQAKRETTQGNNDHDRRGALGGVQRVLQNRKTRGA